MTKAINLPPFVKTFMDTFRENGFSIYVVGGPVRDWLLKRPITNWDFATSAKPDQILSMFDNAVYENDYGTVIVPLIINQDDPNSNVIAEVTPYRKEGSYSDVRHPDSIEWANTIEEDVQRRDFTINALAYDGKQIIDAVGGEKDLKNKCIRAVGDPDKRFKEDALRLLRAARFAVQLGFTIEPETRDAIIKNAQLITHVSWERIRDEFLKIMASERPADGILLLRDLGLLTYILPELEACFGVEQESPGRHHTLGVGMHSVEALRHTPSKDSITRLAALLHDVGKPLTREVTEEGVVTFYNHEIVGADLAHDIAVRLRLSKKDKFKLVALVRYHMFSVTEEQTDKAIRRFIKRVGKDNIKDILDLRTGDRIGSGVPETSWRTELFKKRIVEVQKKPFTIHDLAITGHDVMKELDMKPGPEVGKILDELFEKVADGNVKNSRKVLLNELSRVE